MPPAESTFTIAFELQPSVVGSLLNDLDMT